MSGYRQSGFDPNAGEQAGRPLRPFNWVQWVGVACFGLMILMLLAEVAGWLGFMSRVNFFAALPGLSLASIALINSRRQPLVDPADREQRERNRKMLLIAVIVLIFILGAAVFIQFSGA